MSWFIGFQDLIRFDEDASDSTHPVWREDGSSRWGYIFPVDLGAPGNLKAPGNPFLVNLVGQLGLELLEFPNPFDLVPLSALDTLGSLEVLALRGVLGSHHYPVDPEGLVEPVRLI